MNDWQKSARRILITVAVIYLLFCVSAVCSVMQRRLLYFPTKIPANAVEAAAKEHGFLPWKNPAGQIIGWKIPANGPAAGSVLIVHGGNAVILRLGPRLYRAMPIHDMRAPGSSTRRPESRITL